jgi:tRNA 2-thiouridine synthesizing protein A
MAERQGRADPFGAVDEWDAADMGCGELVIFLRLRLKAMPGEVLRLTARDPGAPEDLPSWCRMTRNSLIHHDPEAKCFWIRSRTDWS